MSEQSNGQGHTAGEGQETQPVAVYVTLNPRPHHRQASAHKGHCPPSFLQPIRLATSDHTNPRLSSVRLFILSQHSPRVCLPRLAG